MKKKAIVFGAGKAYTYGRKQIETYYEVVGIIDNDCQKHGKDINGIIINSFDKIDSFDFDVIIVTPKNNDGIIKQLTDYGVKKERLIEFEDAIEFAYKNLRLSIAIIYHGGMGDFLIGKNWIYHVYDKYVLDNTDIDVFVEHGSFKMGDSVFGEDRIIHNIYDLEVDLYKLEQTFNYDLVVNFCIVPCIQYLNGPKIACYDLNFLDFVLELQKFGLHNYNTGFCDNSHYYKTVRKIFEKFPQKNYYSFCDVLGNLNISEKFLITFEPIIDAEEYLDSVNLRGKKFITIDTGLNKDYLTTGNTRAWSHENWNRLAQMLKERYTDYSIVQVGAKMSDNDDIDADVNLNGKTSIEEAKVLLKHAVLHIDYEGGLVHVRHILSGGPSIVLFGSTLVQWHKYSENINIRTQFCDTGCEWTSKNWLFDCPKGYEKPLCIESITPEMVMEQVDKVLCIN